MRRPLPLVAAIPYWCDNELAREAVESARGLTRVFVCDGRFADVEGPDLSEPVENWWYGNRQSNLIELPGRIWASEGEKRQALLAAAQFGYERGWLLWLDSDELLRNSEGLAELLSDLPEGTLCFPLPFLDDDGQVVLATWKLVYFDQSTSWAGRGYFYRHGGVTYDLCGPEGPIKLGPHAWPQLSACAHLVHRPQRRPPERVRQGTKREHLDPAPAVFEPGPPLDWGRLAAYVKGGALPSTPGRLNERA